MSAIPIHIQRRFERRWASRFAPPAVAQSRPRGTIIGQQISGPPRCEAEHFRALPAVRRLCRHARFNLA
jgi:hypothetical protein